MCSDTIVVLASSHKSPLYSPVSGHEHTTFVKHPIQPPGHGSDHLRGIVSLALLLENSALHWHFAIACFLQ